MTDNPTGAENAQIQDDADRKARELAVQILTPHGATDVYIAGAAGAIATALREVDREAEQRGMMRAAGIAREYPAEEHGALHATPAYAARQAANEIARAIIECAAKD